MHGEVHGEVYPSLVLLLGSYDPETKRVLLEIKELVAREFQEHVYALLLETLELYKVKRGDEDLYLMMEGEAPAAYLFTKKGGLETIIPLDKGGDEGARKAAEELGLIIEYKLPILEKLESLAKACDLVFVLRHVELTRCGEYIELTFLLEQGLEPSKVYFLWNRSVPVSSMLLELADYHGFNIRPYSGLDELQAEIHRIIYYRVARKRSA